MAFGTLKFRHRIVLLVVVAALALLTVTAVTLVLGRRNERQVSAVQTRYVPLLELDRDLKGLYARIPRALEDAAGSGEETALAQADALRDELARRLDAGGVTIGANGGDPIALKSELATYYAIAREVSARLLAGTPPTELAGRIDAMQRVQQTFASHLDAAVTPDRDRLAAAFEAARASQRTALAIDIAVASIALLLMAMLSSRIIRRTVEALREVAMGMERLGRGEFDREINVTTRDELGDLAQEANRTAVHLVVARQALEDKAAELARASRYKSEFVANMSHELRTPLNSIMILSALLGENEEQTLSDKQVEFAKLIHRSGQELLALINDVLDLSKVEAGKQVIVFESVVVAELAAYARSMFQPLATQRSVELVVEVSADAPPMIRTDQARLAQILKNLLSNAFKFTSQGRVVMRIASAPPCITISVTDTGIGIPVDKLELIFEAFAQAETGTSRTYGGTGLGLTIARQLAVRLGGDLRVVSEVGVGSTFEVILPIDGQPTEGTQRLDIRALALPRAPFDEPARDGAATARPSRPVAPQGANTTPEPALHGKIVLIVDDDMRNVYSLANALRTRHLQVLTAATAEEAIDELEQHPNVDMVLMDAMMSEATPRIRAQPRFSTLPIVALTTPATRPGQGERCVEAGASDHLPKPVDVPRLLELFGGWLDQRGTVK